MKKRACHNQPSEVIHEAAVSLPFHVYAVRPVNVLHSRISTLMTSPFFTQLHLLWKIVTTDPLTLYKLEGQQLSTSEAFCGWVTVSI